MWAPCWPHKPYYQGRIPLSHTTINQDKVWTGDKFLGCTAQVMTAHAIICGLCCLKQVSQAWISNYISQKTAGCNYLSLPEIPASGNKVLIYRLAFLVHPLRNCVHLDTYNLRSSGTHLNYKTKYISSGFYFPITKWSTIICMALLIK